MHFHPTEADKINRMDNYVAVSRYSENLLVTSEVSRKYTVADMITGYGVMKR
jgi:hypothetical protein